ncbi:MAG: ribulokinase [Ignavibacteria bacterium]|jgi:L-ribulokinase|nr:ribulokinase [Ignavibacteria bacterium]
MKKYSLGLDFGTNSCRAIIADLSDGSEIASAVFNYPSGQSGIITDPGNPSVARQNPQDYIEGLEYIIKASIESARSTKDFDARDIISIGVDATSSSVLPVDENMTPLCMKPEFRNNLNAMVWLWKDHSSISESEKITRLAKDKRPLYLMKIGGVYSVEWFWSKILHCLNEDPEVFHKAFSFVEISDYIPAVLTGETDSRNIKRCISAAGHKAMYNDEWGGLPDEQFLALVHPELALLRGRLYEKAVPSIIPAGNLSRLWAEKLGLSESVVISTGCVDAHAGAVGSGIEPGKLVKIIGTSTCDMMIWPKDKPVNYLPGISGVVPDSIVPGYYGIEAGQPAVGDMLLWFVKELTPAEYGNTLKEKFNSLGLEAMKLSAGETGLLALDWNNGNRSVLMDPRLSGLILGQSLYTSAPEIYRALIESTAFGALTIINRLEENGLGFKDIIACGGLALNNPLLMQIYADVTGKTIHLAKSEQTGALGAAILSSVAAGKEKGGFMSLEEARGKMTGIAKSYYPDAENGKTYKELFSLYTQLYESFGTASWHGNLSNVMKTLIKIRDEKRKLK